MFLQNPLVRPLISSAHKLPWEDRCFRDWLIAKSILLHQVVALKTKTILSKHTFKNQKALDCLNTSMMEKGKAALIAIIVTVVFVVLVIILPILICPCFRQVDRQAHKQQRISRPTGVSGEANNDGQDSDVELGLRLITANLLLCHNPEVGFLDRLTLWAGRVFCTRSKLFGVWNHRRSNQVSSAISVVLGLWGRFLEFSCKA